MAKQTQQTQRAPAGKTGNAAKSGQQQQGRSGGGSGGGNGGVDAALAKRLKMMNAKWQGSREESTKPGFGEGTTLSDGRHICRLSAARLIMVKDAPAVVFEFTKVEGDDEIGEKAVRFSNFGKDEQIVYLQRDLRKLGVPVDDFNAEDLPAQLEQLIAEAPAVRLTVKTAGEYRNVYIDKMVELGEGGDTGGGEEAGGDDPAEGEDAGDAGDDTTDEAGDDAGDDGSGDEGVDGSEADGSEDEGDEELPPDAGDKVAVIHKGKKIRGEVKSYNKTTKQIFVTIKGESKAVPFKDWTLLAG